MKRIFLYLFLILILDASCKSEAVEVVQPINKKAVWIANAFQSLENNRYPKIRAISWWHENFDNSFLKVNSTSESLMSYKQGVQSVTFLESVVINANKLEAPLEGIYHAAFPDFGGTEDIVSVHKITDFEALVGKDIAWAYFSDNWYDTIYFPIAKVNSIKSIGKIPFIRMMPRSNFDEGSPDPNYSMQNILDGNYDAAITQWAIAAANTNSPLLVEFGTEVNGNWFPWNGQYNGAGETTEYGDINLADGAERFRDAYRHIITICNANGATNITWFFHINAYGEPNASWNDIAAYYPGDTYIDWLGVSIYGPQKQGENYQEFSDILDAIYPKLLNISDNPIAILEFAITELE